MAYPTYDKDNDRYGRRDNDSDNRGNRRMRESSGRYSASDQADDWRRTSYSAGHGSGRSQQDYAGRQGGMSHDYEDDNDLGWQAEDRNRQAMQGGQRRYRGEDYANRSDYDQDRSGQYGSPYAGQYGGRYGENYGDRQDERYGQRSPRYGSRDYGSGNQGRGGYDGAGYGGGDYGSHGNESRYGSPGNPWRSADANQGQYNQGQYGQGQHDQGQYRGKGPKGYSRSDERIKEDVCDTLTEDSRIDASDISIEVKNGEITLTGTVADRDAKRRAEDIIERSSGVKHVQNNLRIKDSWASQNQSASGTGQSSTSGQTSATAQPKQTSGGSTYGTTGNGSRSY